MRSIPSGFVRISLAAAMTLGLACSSASSSKQPQILSTTHSGISEESIGQQFGTMKVGKVATDPAYGFSEKMPVSVGGGFGDGAHNVYRYLYSLLGPAGQKVHYDRIGTCCPFKTPNSPFDGEGILEVYEISYDGGKPARLYFNWYDSGEILIPAGLSGRK